MTSRQRWIVGVLVTANLVVLVTLLIFVTRFSGPVSGLALPSPVPTYHVDPHFSLACQRQAVEMLGDAELGGTVTLVDKAARFELAYRMREGAPADTVAQHVWTVFDIALHMVNGPCSSFSRVEVVIEGQRPARPVRVYALVGLADLRAFYSGELSESAFIDRVEYQIDAADGSEL